jgi:hypothetical protein
MEAALDKTDGVGVVVVVTYGTECKVLESVQPEEVTIQQEVETIGFLSMIGVILDKRDGSGVVVVRRCSTVVKASDCVQPEEVTIQQEVANTLSLTLLLVWE